MIVRLIRIAVQTLLLSIIQILIILLPFLIFFNLTVMAKLLLGLDNSTPVHTHTHTYTHTQLSNKPLKDDMKS